MSLTSLARLYAEQHAGSASLGPFGEAACSAGYKKIHSYTSKAAGELQGLADPAETAHLQDIATGNHDQGTRNCAQRVLELAEELDYLNDILNTVKTNKPTEYQTLISQRDSVVGDLAAARKLLEKLL